MDQATPTTVTMALISAVSSSLLDAVPFTTSAPEVARPAPPSTVAPWRISAAMICGFMGTPHVGTLPRPAAGAYWLASGGASSTSRISALPCFGHGRRCGLGQTDRSVRGVDCGHRGFVAILPDGLQFLSQYRDLSRL